MLVVKPYNRERAVEYALKWATDRNPLFIDFTGIGGNCTNFVSQAILAGSCTMNYTPDFGWYYVNENDRAPAWSGVEFFYDFLTNAFLGGSCTIIYTPDFGWYYVNENDRAPAWSGVEFFYDFLTGAPLFIEKNGGIGPFAVEISREQAELGDVVQYANADGDWYHTVIITGFEGEEILVSAQSNDARNRPLSSYNFANARFLHLAGVRVEISDDTCFDFLFNGGEAPMPEPPITNAEP